MEIKAAVGSIHEQEVDTIVIYLMEDGPGDHPANATRAVDEALGSTLTERIEAGDISGKVGETLVLYPRGAIPAQRVIVVGLGVAEEFTCDIARRAVATGLQKARCLKAVHVATVTLGTGRGGLQVLESAQAVAEGGLLGLYQYHGQKTSDAPENTLEALTVLAYSQDDLADVERGIVAGRAFAAGSITARNLVNLPPNICTPAYMAEQATSIANETGLAIQVLEKQQMTALKMGALLAVARGSDTPPRFIIMEHNADKADDLNTVVLVGKGVTFDTGGYSLKTRDGMVGMKADMGGGAAVIGAMHTVALLDLPLHIVGLIPAADNRINGDAYLPQEVVTASNGKTIEIISTDAEGRMLLADALVYAKRYEPSAVVDIATLTGSCMIALGGVAAGLFSTDEKLTETVKKAADSTQEKVWELPLFDEYNKVIESDTADMKNAGGRFGGVGSSAVFLKNFVDYPAWAHIDIAGMATEAKDNPYMPGKGATGFGSRLLAEFVRQWDQR